jgi:uncharacterized protein with PQ loop repeat
MNTKLLLTAASIFLGLLGLLFSFVPQEMLVYFSADASDITVLFLQLLGATYLGFAILNWTAKGALIGGIYNRPVAIGNFGHFTIGAITLVKLLFDFGTSYWPLSLLALCYLLFAIAFTYLFRNNPKKVTDSNK